jgi:hypothetical protein
MSTGNAMTATTPATVARRLTVNWRMTPLERSAINTV